MKQFAHITIMALVTTVGSACSVQPQTETSSNRSVGGVAEADRSSGDAVQQDPQPKVVDERGEEKLHQATVKTLTLETVDGQASVRLQPTRRFATADAFEKIYRRVFPAQALRRANLNAYFTSFPNDYFTMVEKANLGSFNVSSPLGTEVNVEETKNLSLSYTRSVRGFLADACNKLVDQEIALVKTKPEDNLIVTKEGVPTAASLNKFAVRLFGYAHPDGTFPQVNTYASIIKESLESMSKAGFAATSAEYVASLRSNYILYCVAMGQDPDLYIY